MRSEMKRLFIQNLEKYFSNNSPEVVNIYRHLFDIKDDNEFEEDLIHTYEVWNGVDSYFGEEGKENWFTIFHKRIRQNDYFNRTFKTKKVELISKEELSELRGLRFDLSEGKFKKQSEEGKHPFTAEYRRILDLGSKQRREEENVSIAGNLDMILWNTIHLDKSNVLSRAMVMFFEEDMNDFYKLKNK